MTDFVRLSIAIDSSSAKTAAKDIERLGAAGDAAVGKIRRLVASVGSLMGTRCLNGLAKETTVLSTLVDVLSIAMNAAGQDIDHTQDQIAQFGTRLVATGNEIGSLIQLIEFFRISFGGAFQSTLDGSMDALTKRLAGMNKILGEATKINNNEQISNYLNASTSAEAMTSPIIDTTQITKNMSELQKFIQTKTQAIMISKELTATEKAEAAGAINIAAARKINTQTIHDEIIAKQRKAIENLGELKGKGLITAAIRSEAIARRENAIAMLAESRVPVAAGGGEIGAIATLASLIGGKAGWAGLVITGLTAAWGYFKNRREQEEAAIQKVRREQRDYEMERGRERTQEAQGIAQRIASFELPDTINGNREAQTKWNQAIEDARLQYRDLEDTIRQDNGVWTHVAGEGAGSRATPASMLKAMYFAGQAEYNKITEAIGKTKDKDEKNRLWAQADAKQAENTAVGKEWTDYLKDDPIRSARDADKDAEAAKKRADARADFIRDLENEIATMGKSEETRRRMEAANLGLGKSYDNLNPKVEELLGIWKDKRQEEFIKSIEEETKTLGADAAETTRLEAAKLGLAGAIEKTNHELEKSIAERGKKQLGLELEEKEKEMAESGLAASELYRRAKQAEIDKLVEQKEHIGEVADEQKRLNNIVAAMRADELKARLSEWAPEIYRAADGAKKLAQTMQAIEMYAVGLPPQIAAMVKAMLAAKAWQALTPEGQDAEREADRLKRLKDSYTEQYKDPMENYREKQADLRKIFKETDETYKKALDDLNKDTMRKLAEMGDTWAIFGTVIQGSSQNATDALVRWMDDLDGVGRSWVSLRETVKGVVRDMLLEMQKMIIQKNIMEPLFNKAAGLFGGLAGIAPQAQGGAPDAKDIALEQSKNNIIATMAEVNGAMAMLKEIGIAPLETALGTLTGKVGGTQGSFVLFDKSLGITAKAVDTLGTAAANAIIKMEMAEVGKKTGDVLTYVIEGVTVTGTAGPKASGGSVLSSSTYLVGERGPELFVSKTAGAIIPNNRLGAGGAGGASVTIVQNISAGGTGTKTSAPGGGSQPWANMAKAVEGIVRETIRKEQRQGNSLNPVFPRGGGL
jgi:hypothetical protein